MTGRDVQRVGDAFGALGDELQAARQSAPSEVVMSPDGSQAVIQWEGTPVSAAWITTYVNRLIAARLVEQWASGATDADRERARAINVERLAAWHRALGGLPEEGLEAARQRFEVDGTGQRWFLRPADVSRVVRAHAVRKIPEGRECAVHPGRLADTCRECADGRRASVSPEFIRRLRAEVEQEREDGADG